MSNSNNMYPTVPSAPTEEGMEPTKMYPPIQAVSGEAYPMPPPPAYSEHAPILQNAPQPSTQTTIGKCWVIRCIKDTRANLIHLQ